MNVKKGLALAIILLFISVSVAPSTGTVVEQSTVATSNGKTLYVGGSGEGNYTRIQDAIDNASDGDTVFVYNGIYHENIIIDKDYLTLCGEDKDNTIIDGTESGRVILVLKSSITIRDFAIQNAGTTGRGVEVYNENYNIRNIYISDCIVKLNGMGIRLKDASNISISGCWINNNSEHSIKVGGCSDGYSNNISITDCRLDYNGQDWGGGYVSGGIVLRGFDFSSLDVSISECEIYDNLGIGIWAMEFDNVYIYNNNIYSNTRDGIVIESHCDHVEIHGNNIYDNDQNGFFIARWDEAPSDISIYDNEIVSNNRSGIYLEYSSNNTITGNNIISNNWYGIYLENSFFNRVKENNFIGNNQSASFQNSFFNRWDGNYWNRPRLLPKLIFGKNTIFSKLIPWFNIDWHPAKEPYDI